MLTFLTDKNENFSLNPSNLPNNFDLEKSAISTIEIKQETDIQSIQEEKQQINQNNSNEIFNSQIFKIEDCPTEEEIIKRLNIKTDNLAKALNLKKVKNV